MICPKCKKESDGGKWCSNCGIRLETEVNITGNSFGNKAGNSDSKEGFSYVSSDFSQGNQPSKKGMSNSLKITLAILIPVLAVIIVVTLLYATGVLDFGKNEPDPGKDSVVLENEDTQNLIKRGMNHLKIGDYEEAETVFKVVIETDPENEEIVTLCQILHNYNRGMNRIRSKDYEGARSYYDKIPSDYTEYEIAPDVESLKSEIERYEIANNTFERVKELMSSSDYENAAKTIELIDETCLAFADTKLLEEYKEEIESFIRDEKKRKETQVKLDEKTAENIIRRFCSAYVDAVNAGDFSLVSPYIKGDLYDMQKNMVTSLHSQGITEEFNFLTVQSVNKIGENIWKVNVTEGETIFYPDGTKSEKTYTWTYTIEYVDSIFYLTNIE